MGRPHPAATPGPPGRPGDAAGGDPAVGYPSLVRGGCPPRPASGQRGPPGLSGAVTPARRNWNPDRAARVRYYTAKADEHYTFISISVPF